MNLMEFVTTIARALALQSDPIPPAPIPDIVQKVIRKMRHQKLEEIAADPEIQEIYKPLY